MQEQCTEHLPSMIVPLWSSARTLTPRVKGCEGLCGLYFKNIILRGIVTATYWAHNPELGVRVPPSLQIKGVINL